MQNKVENWSYDKPKEEGIYLVCMGDVESPYNLELVYFTHFEGKLCDDDRVQVKHYHPSSKFAKLSFN